MTLVQCDTVTFGYAGQTLFRDVSFSLGARDRLALVAPNGAGKTSLLCILARELEPDAGRVITPRDARVGYLKQALELPDEQTLLDALLSGFRDILELHHGIERANARAAAGDPSALDELAGLQDRYELAGGHGLEARVQILAETLGFNPRALDRPVSSLSGGERGRLALGIVLAASPEVLLLDEPTNHLDIETTERLEGLLASYAGAVIVVSHDRAFLDATCNVTGELGRQRFRLYHARYSDYTVLREQDLERETAARERQTEEIERTEDFIRRNIAGQKTKQAQSRRKALSKLERLEQPEDVWAQTKRFRLRFAEAPRSGDIVLEASGLGAERGRRTLFQGVDLLLRRGDRVAIIGPNGAGKTTMLRLLAGQSDPVFADLGSVRRGSNVLPAYFDQHLETLDPARSAIAEIQQVRGDLVVDAVREYLARFQIRGDDPFRAVGSLSGGERTRLALAKMLLVPRNFLLLDEPTNHLDIPSTEILEDALAEFEGAVLVVSHDRYFLDRVSTKVMHIAGGSVTLYSGGFADFRASSSRAATGADEQPAATGTRDQSPRHEFVREVGSPSPGRDARDARKAELRHRTRRRKRLDELETEIAQGEAELASLRAMLVAGDVDWEKLAEMAERERELSRAVDRKTDEWGKLADWLAREPA